MIKNDLVGLVVNMPEGLEGLGVVINVIKQNKTTYLATVVTDKGDTMIAQMRIDVIGIGEDVDYLDYTVFDTVGIANRLRTGKDV